MFLQTTKYGFPHSSAGKESTFNVEDLSSIPGLGRSLGDGIDYPLQYPWASLVAQLVKNLPAVREIWIRSLGWGDPLEEEGHGNSLLYCFLENPMDRGAWWATVHGITNSQTQLRTHILHNNKIGIYP